MRSVVFRVGMVAGLAAGTTQLAAPQPPLGHARPFQIGKAAWYGEEFHGRETANGETFNMNDLTGAHRKLPLGSRVRVTNLRNGKTVVVRINDRGPWGFADRIIDLSHAASRRLDMIETGVEEVRLDRLIN